LEKTMSFGQPKFSIGPICLSFHQAPPYGMCPISWETTLITAQIQFKDTTFTNGDSRPNLTFRAFSFSSEKSPVLKYLKETHTL
jgi:hypothetical protein